MHPPDHPRRGRGPTGAHVPAAARHTTAHIDWTTIIPRSPVSTHTSHATCESPVSTAPSSRSPRRTRGGGSSPPESLSAGSRAPCWHAPATSGVAFCGVRHVHRDRSLTFDAPQLPPAPMTGRCAAAAHTHAPMALLTLPPLRLARSLACPVPPGRSLACPVPPGRCFLVVSWAPLVSLGRFGRRGQGRGGARPGALSAARAGWRGWAPASAAAR